MKRIAAGTYFVIGIDGGGTKTAAVLADARGKILIQKEGASSNYHAIGEDQARDNLKKLIVPLVRKYLVRSIAFGLAGLDSKKDLSILKKMVGSILPRGVLFSLHNDAEIALEAMSCPGPKVLVISGTGSAIWAQCDGLKVKAGGLSFLLADEGSAYDFGMKALRAAARSFDGRGQKTILEKLILKKTGAKNIPDAAAKIYLELHESLGDIQTNVASFAPLVGIAFGKRDAVARKILEDAADELFLGVQAVVQKLNIIDTNLCVGYVGSTFRAPLMKNLLSAKIKNIAPKACFVGTVNPVFGAVQIALRQM